MKGQPQSWPFSSVTPDLVVLLHERLRRKNLERDSCQSCIGHLQLLRCSVRQINYPVFITEIAAIGNANHNGPLVPEIDHSNQRPKWESRVASRHGVHIERFATRRFPSVENRAIPGSNTSQQFPVLAFNLGWVRRRHRQIRRCTCDIRAGRCRWPWHHCIGAHRPGG